MKCSYMSIDFLIQNKIYFVRKDYYVDILAKSKKKTYSQQLQIF